MKIVFSQKWAEEKYGKRIREILWRIVKLARATKKCDNLLVKVFFYTKQDRIRGNYRNIWIHGFYDKEWNKYAKKFEGIITLKLPKNATDEEIAQIFAHELGHHLSFVKHRRFGEKTANKFEEKVIQRWKNS